jgi:hypothetical protein
LRELNQGPDSFLLAALTEYPDSAHHGGAIRVTVSVEKFICQTPAGVDIIDMCSADRAYFQINSKIAPAAWTIESNHAISIFANGNSDVTDVLLQFALQ